MNINSSGLSALFSASEDFNTVLPSSDIEGMTPESFADALKNQIKQLTNMKEIAGQLSEEGVASEFSAFFGNGLPLGHAIEKTQDIESTIEALENVLNSLENVVTDEINLENRLQGLIEKTEALKTETLGSVELEEKVSRLAEELQKIQGIQQLVSQHNEQENTTLSFTEETKILENQINQISKNLGLDEESNPLNLIGNAILTEQTDGAKVEKLEAELGQEQAEIAVNTQAATIIPAIKQAVEYVQVMSPTIAGIKPEINKEDLVVRQIVEQKVPENTEQTETDSLLQQENAFAKPRQDIPVIATRQNEGAQLSQDIDLLPSNEKTLPRFAADVAMLNKAVVNENAETLPAMGKHFAHPEWNKEMGERVLWMYKQAIPAAELKLNPRHLGPISIRVDVNQDQATVVFTAQHAAVKEAIEAAIPKLREMFSAQQLTLTDVNVSQDDAGQKQSKGFSQMENQSGNERSKEPGSFAQNEQDSDLLDIAEEIEAGRAIASNGILSVFA